MVSDSGRVVSLIYRRTPYGLVRMDEFAGHLDPVYFEKFVRLSNVTKVGVNGTKGLWIKGPQELVYVTRDGTPAAASARLTTGNTLIWGTGQVALRLEGNFGRSFAPPHPCRARRSIVGGRADSPPGPPSPCRPSGGSAAWGRTSRSLAHRVRSGHRGHRACRCRAADAPPQDSRHP